MEIIFILSAEIDWFDLYRTYGNSFETPFSRSLEILKSHPEIGPPSKISPIRRLVIRQTPWGIFYKVERHRIVIIAIEDLRQDPASIEKKLKNLKP